MNSPTTDDEDMSGAGSGSAFKEEPPSFAPTPPNVDVTTSVTPYSFSVPLLAVVAVIAIVTLIVFAVATFRYCCAHKGSYLVRECRGDIQLKEKSETTKINNIYEQEPTKEWLL